jgi:tRNA A-37 threonylcarbamoyl transferase component Bud32
MKMDKLEPALEQALKGHPHGEVFSFEAEGERYWIKRPRRTGSNLLHRGVWHLSRFPILVPVQAQSPREALLHESGKLRRLRERGLPVPEVLSVTDRYFVMRDTGTPLRKLLYRRDPDPRLTLGSFETLARLHRTGEYHGGSQLRNLTWDGQRIHLIDFEESFDGQIDRKVLQLRDLFLLLFSIAKDRIPIDYRQHIARYREISGNDDFDRRLREMFQNFGWLEKIIAFPPLWRLLDKDTRATYRLIQELKKL